MTRPGSALQAITFALHKTRNPSVTRSFLRAWLQNGSLLFDTQYRGFWERYLLWLETEEAKKIGGENG